MALLKPVEFAEKCGIARASVTVNKKRGKIIVDKKGLIDDTNPLNKAFYEHQLKLREKRKPMGEHGAGAAMVGVNYDSNEKIPIKEGLNSGKKDKNTQKRKSESNWVDEKIEQDKVKREVETDFKRQQLRLARMEEEKILGKLIPTDVVRSLFGQHFKSITTAFKQSVDVIAIEFGKKARLNRNEQADMRGLMITALNRAIDEGINMSKKSLKAIVDEYSQAKMK